MEEAPYEGSWQVGKARRRKANADKIAVEVIFVINQVPRLANPAPATSLTK